MPEEKGWNLAVGYDYRFGSMRISPVSPVGERVADFAIRIADLLRGMNIPPHEMRAHLQEAERPSSPERDIEDVRREAIERTNVYGKAVLDIGGYDGWAAKLALDRGAARAICLDNQQYHHYGWEDIRKEGVEYITGDFMDLELDRCKQMINGPLVLGWRDPLPRPDIIIFYNVLYHLKNPWAGLDRLREIVKPGGEMLLCTLFRYHDGAWMYVYEPRECNPTDETVYFGPSLMALERLLTATGWDFEQTGLAMDRVVYRCRPTPGFERRHQDT